MPIDARKAQDLDPNDKGLIDLDTYTNDNFTLFGFTLSKVLDDIILVKYADLGDESGTTVMRGGIAIPVAHVQRAWRIGEVILAGPHCKHVKAGDHVCFPSDKGVPCSNLDVEKVGLLTLAVFLNEQRIFGICKVSELNSSDADKPRVTQKRPSKQRRRDKV